jgi:hypothetical protein
MLGAAEKNLPESAFEIKCIFLSRAIGVFIWFYQKKIMSSQIGKCENVVLKWLFLSAL